MPRANCRECGRTYETAAAAERAVHCLQVPMLRREVIDVFVKRWGPAFWNCVCDNCVSRAIENANDHASWKGNTLTDEEEHYGRRNE